MYNYQYSYDYPSYVNYAPVHDYYDPTLYTSDASTATAAQVPTAPPSTAPHADLLGNLFELFKKYAPTALEVLAPIAGAAIGSLLLPGVGTVEGEAAGSLLGRLGGSILGRLGGVFGRGAASALSGVPAAAASTIIPQIGHVV
ncbi:MAG: hypothetical protein RLZ12_110 [Bacillota bacterium]